MLPFVAVTYRRRLLFIIAAADTPLRYERRYAAAHFATLLFADAGAFSLYAACCRLPPLRYFSLMPPDALPLR